jgi:hypothetical protein
VASGGVDAQSRSILTQEQGPQCSKCLPSISGTIIWQQLHVCVALDQMLNAARLSFTHNIMLGSSCAHQTNKSNRPLRKLWSSQFAAKMQLLDILHLSIREAGQKEGLEQWVDVAAIKELILCCYSKCTAHMQIVNGSQADVLQGPAAAISITSQQRHHRFDKGYNLCGLHLNTLG